MNAPRFTPRSAAEQFARLASQRHGAEPSGPTNMDGLRYTADGHLLDEPPARSRSAIRNDPNGPTREEATRLRRERERQAAWALVAAVILLATIIAWAAFFSERAGQ